MTNIENTLGVVDYLVIASLMVLSSSIGLYYRFSGGKQATLKEYMLADRSMSPLPVAFSLMASFMSAITLLGVVREMYMFGTQFIMINISYILASPIVSHFYLPVFYGLQKTSVYEYLELRFGYPTRLLASIAFTLQMVLYMGIVVYAPALALASVTGLSEQVSIILVGSVCTFYSSLGGMKAVLLTDVFQSLLMFAAISIVIVTGLSRYTVSQVFSAAHESGRLEFFNMSADPRTRHTLWTQVIGGSFTYLSLYGVNQAQVQRLLSVRSLRKSQQAVWLQCPILMGLSFSTAFAGLIIYTHYQHCDPHLQGTIKNPDQVLPRYIVDLAGDVPGVTGLFVAGIFSGSLSTVSSALNSLAAVTLYDYLYPLVGVCCPGLAPLLSAPITSPLLSCLFGIICIGLAFLTALLGTGVLQASLTVFGAVGGPLLGLFTLGMSSKRANQKGALAGLLVGLMLSMWIGFGQPKPSAQAKPRSVEGCPVSSLNATLDSHWSVVAVTELSSSSQSTTMPDWLVDQQLPAPQSPAPLNISFTPPSSLVRDDDQHMGTEGDKMEEENGYSPVHELYAISYAWVGAIGFLATFTIGTLVSCCTAPPPSTSVAPELIASWCRRPEPRTTNEEEIAMTCEEQLALSDEPSVVTKL